MAIQMWVKHDGTGDKDATLVRKGNGGFEARFVGSGEERPIYFDLGRTFQSITSNSGIPADQWTHVTINYDGNNLQIYINGELDAETGENADIDTDSGGPFRIGIGPSESGARYEGQIDDLRIWDTSLDLFQKQTNPYVELSGSESGLVSYYTFDESGSTIVDQAGQNDLSLEATASKIAPDAFPVTPDVYATSSNGRVTVEWDERLGVQESNNDADKFRVYRSTGPDGDNRQMVTSVGAGTTSYTDTAVSNSETYYYEVTSIIDDSESDYAKAAIARPYNHSGGVSLELDGEDDYATLSPRPSLELGERSNDDGTGSKEMTLEAWVKHDGGSDDNARILMKGSGYKLRFAGSGEERPVYFDLGRTFQSITSNSGIPANEWTHVAIAYTGSELQLYINGELDKSTSEGADIDYGSGRPLRVGTNDGANGNFFDGEIDDVRIWSTARTPAEIEGNYTQELTGNEDSLRGYWRFDSQGASQARGSGELQGMIGLKQGASITEDGGYPVAPRVYARGDDGSVRITWSERGENDADSINIYRSSDESRSDRQLLTQVSPDTDSYTDTSVSNGETYYYEATSLNNAGQESDYSVPATALVSQNPPGNAFAFDGGQDAYGSVSARPSLALSDRTLTVESWIKFNESADDGATILRRGNGYKFTLVGNGSDRDVYFDVGRSFQSIKSSQGLNAGQWTHVAVTYDGNELSMYINGKLDSSTSEGANIDTPDQPLQIGTELSENSGFYGGQLDEIRVWDTTRTPEQINASYDEELVGDETGLVGYWRGCNVASDTEARGSAVRPMTINLTDVACQPSGVPMGGDESTDDTLDIGIELQQSATVTQGGSVDIDTFPNNRADQSVSGTLELLVDQNGDGQFNSGESVTSKSVTLAADTSTTETLTYSNVGLAAGDYSYQAQFTSGSQAETSFTNGTLNVTGGDGTDTGFLSVDSQPSGSVSANSSFEIDYRITNPEEAPTNFTLTVPTTSADLSVAGFDGEIRGPNPDGTPPSTFTTAVAPGQTASVTVTYRVAANATGTGNVTVEASSPGLEETGSATTAVEFGEPAGPSTSRGRASVQQPGTPGGQARVQYTITDISSQASVALEFTRLPSQLSVNTSASTTTGTFGQNNQQLVFLQPSNEVRTTIAFDIPASARADATFDIEATVLDENSTPTDTVTTTVGDVETGPVARFDADDDGEIELQEVQTAIRAFSNGELDLQGVQQVIGAFSS